MLATEVARELAPLARSRNTQQSTRSGRNGLTLDALEPLDRQNEDHGAAHLNLEREGHEELPRLHDRRDWIHDLGARVAIGSHERHYVIHFVLVHTDHDRRVGLLEKPARTVQPGGAVLVRLERILQHTGIFVMDDGDDKLHEVEYTSRHHAEPDRRALDRPLCPLGGWLYNRNTNRRLREEK
jgi:hypothetical protein